MTRAAVVLLALLAATGCREAVRPDAPASDIPRAWEALEAACERQDADTVVCRRVGFLAGLGAAVDAWRIGSDWRDRAEAAEAHAATDAAVFRGHLQQARDRAAWLETERWLWGLGGVVAGALALGLAFGLGG